MSCMAGPSGEEKYICYSDASSNGNQNIQTHILQSFGPSPNPEIYNLSSTGMENMIGFNHSKNPHDIQNGAVLWKPPGQSSSGKEINHDFYDNHRHAFTTKQHDLTELLDHVDEQSLRSCVFPCEGNERPSHGLSLSLNSSNPSTIGLQSFELRQQQQQQQNDDHDLIRSAPSISRSANAIQNSRYLGPTQELLNEFCNLDTKHGSDHRNNNMNSKMKGVEKNNSDSSLYSLDLLELQRRKTKLLQMLDEVDRRYKHYCDQMRAVIASFESVAGNGAAKAYSALASRAMSRHFRCLKDAILGQIKATKKAMGEKDNGVTLGTMKGETPRLRLLDQTLRQQRAMQQMSNMEIHPWRPQRGLPERSVSVLRAWLFEHFLHPYPSDVDKHILARQTGLSRSQVSNWFINARVRLWKPMVEEMYMEELKENDENNMGALNDAVLLNNLDHDDDHGLNNHNRSSDQKPTHDQLVRIDSECLSSIISNNNNNADKNDVGKNKTLQFEPQNPNFGRVGDSYGAMEFDFSSYSSAGAAAYGGAAAGGVSLTLGLHQHASGGVNLQFSPSASQSSLFYGRDQIEDCQTVQYSLLENESQTLPYRNLMGAQLLHDLAG